MKLVKNFVLTTCLLLALTYSAMAGDGVIYGEKTPPPPPPPVSAPVSTQPGSEEGTKATGVIYGEAAETNVIYEVALNLFIQFTSLL